MSVDCAIEAQGSLTALARKMRTPPPGRGIRGCVTYFSDNSRRRLMKKLARLKATKAVFITLTYPDEFPGPRTAYAHLRAYLERFRYHYPQASAVWRLEYQERGAPHFHILFYNLPFLDRSEWHGWWARIVDAYVDDNEPRVSIEVVRSRRGIMYYVSKYIAKSDVDEDGNISYFIHLTYPHKGRFWGIHNKHALPWAERLYIVLRGVPAQAFDAMKQVLAREWSGINSWDGKGATLFTDCSYILLSEMQDILKGA